SSWQYRQRDSNSALPATAEGVCATAGAASASNSSAVEVLDSIAIPPVLLRPDAVLARRQNTVRIQRRLDAFIQAHHRMVVEVELMRQSAMALFRSLVTDAGAKGYGGYRTHLAPASVTRLRNNAMA